MSGRSQESGPSMHVFAYRNALYWAKQITFAGNDHEQRELAVNRCLEQIKKMIAETKLDRKM